MMKQVLLKCARLILSGIAVFSFCYVTDFAMTAQGGPPPSQKPEIPLLGFDPVLLLQGKEVPGDLNISVTRGRYKYLFASAENKARFEQSPERYEIQLGGACPREGMPNPIREAEIYFVYKDRLYVFDNFECQKAFAAAPESFFETAASAPPITPSPEAVQKGMLLIEKAVAAIGGAALIDGLTSYREVSATTEILGEPGGRKTAVKNTTTIVFPSQIRKEQTTGADSVTLVMTAGEAFGIFQNRTFPMPQSQRVKQERPIKLKPLSILKARHNAGFKVSSAASQKSGETTLEQLVIEFDGLTITLGLEPASGRIQRLSYRGRGPNYDFGEIAQTFSDFRTIEGVTLPFKISGTFNGQPEPTQSSVIGSIKLNEKIDPAMFERPKPPVRQ